MLPDPLVVPLKTLLILELRLERLRLHLNVDAGGSTLRDPDRPAERLCLRQTLRYSEQVEHEMLSPFLADWMAVGVNPLEAVLQVERMKTLLFLTLSRADYWRDAVLQTFIDEGIPVSEKVLRDGQDTISRRTWRDVILKNEQGLKRSPLSMEGRLVSSLDQKFGAWIDYGFSV